MAEFDGALMMKIGELIGQVQALHSRFNGVDASISAISENMNSRVAEHERREEARLTTIETELNSVKRLVWIGFGGIIVLSATLSFLERMAKWAL